MVFNQATIVSFILLASHGVSNSGNFFAHARIPTKNNEDYRLLKARNRNKPGKGGKGRGKGGKGKTKSPSMSPSAIPSATPSSEPSAMPSSEPSSEPSAMPSAEPSSLPSSQPSAQPSSLPSVSPSSLPSSSPSQAPSSLPSSRPSLSQNPSATPSQMPTQDDCFCASGAVEFVYQPISLTYEAHVTRAERLECILATIRNGDELSAATGSLPSLPPGTLLNLYLGLGRVGSGDTDGDFLWVDGTPYDSNVVGFFPSTPSGANGAVIVNGALVNTPAGIDVLENVDGTDKLPALYKCCEFGSTADFAQCNIIDPVDPK